MNLRRLNRIVVTLSLSVLAPAAIAGDFSFAKHIVNPDSAFEICGVGDINRDGVLDIMCGDTWYEGSAGGPEPWTRHHVREVKLEGDYYHDFANELQDVNGDGCLDFVSCTWHTKSVFWCEQPDSLDQTWSTHHIDAPGNIETGFHTDINADGLLDFFPQVAQLTVWYEKLRAPQDGSYWTRRDVGKPAGHGGGVGDLDADGDMDIVVRGGWYEHKDGSGGQDWTWHDEFELGTASVPILIHDYTQDGLPDIVWGFGHDYGVYWIEQGKSGGKRTWTKRTIDKSWSQPHYMELADLNGDGTPEVVTGKRYHAHNGHDPGGEEPLIVCIYEWNAPKKTFERFVIDRATRTGFGLKATTADLDEDGDIDIICPGKSGLYWFENLRR